MKVWQMGMWIAVLVVSASSCAFATGLQDTSDDCDCRLSWQPIPRETVLCPPGNERLPECRPPMEVGSISNPHCDRSLILPGGVITTSITRNWIWTTDTKCGSLNWPPDSEQVCVSLPSVGVGPCAWARRIIVWQEECFRQGYRCSDPEKVTMRFYKECRPVVDVQFGQLPDCECPHDPVVVVIEDEFIIRIIPVKTYEA